MLKKQRIQSLVYLKAYSGAGRLIRRHGMQNLNFGLAAPISTNRLYALHLAAGLVRP